MVRRHISTTSKLRTSQLGRSKDYVCRLTRTPSTLIISATKTGSMAFFDSCVDPRLTNNRSPILGAHTPIRLQSTLVSWQSSICREHGTSPIRQAIGAAPPPFEALRLSTVFVKGEMGSVFYGTFHFRPCDYWVSSHTTIVLADPGPRLMTTEEAARSLCLVQYRRPPRGKWVGSQRLIRRHSLASLR